MYMQIMTRAAVTKNSEIGIRFLSAISQSVMMSHQSFNMQNFNTAELRPVEFARAYLQKKMMKKPSYCGSTCSAHVSRKP